MARKRKLSAPQAELVELLEDKGHILIWERRGTGSQHWVWILYTGGGAAAWPQPHQSTVNSLIRRGVLEVQRRLVVREA